MLQVTNLPKKLTNPKKESGPYNAPVKALSELDRRKIDVRLSKRQRESTASSMADNEIKRLREHSDEVRVTSAAEANKIQRLDSEKTFIGGEIQKTLDQMGRRE